MNKYNSPDSPSIAKNAKLKSEGIEAFKAKMSTPRLKEDETFIHTIDSGENVFDLKLHVIHKYAASSSVKCFLGMDHFGDTINVKWYEDDDKLFDSFDEDSYVMLISGRAKAIVFRSYDLTSSHMEIVNPKLVKIEEFQCSFLKKPISFCDITHSSKDDLIDCIIGKVEFELKKKYPDNAPIFTIDLFDNDSNKIEIVAFDKESQDILRATAGQAFDHPNKKFVFRRLKVNVWESKKNLVFKDGSDVCEIVNESEMLTPIRGGKRKEEFVSKDVSDVSDNVRDDVSHDNDGVATNRGRKKNCAKLT